LIEWCDGGYEAIAPMDVQWAGGAITFILSVGVVSLVL
jgi:hypothetical protein